MNKLITLFRENRQRNTVFNIAFFIFYSLLLIFLDLFRNNITTNFLIFWILVLPIFIFPLYNIFSYRKGDKKTIIMTIIQVILIIFILHMIRIILSDYQMLFSDDGYAIIDSAKYMLTNNYLVFDQKSPDYTKWFIVPIIYDEIALLLNINLIKTAIFLPSLISSIGSIFVFLFGIVFFRKEKAVLLGYLLFSAFVFYNITHSSAHPEFMAFIFIFISLFCIFKAKLEENPLIWNLLAITFIFLTCASNYTSAFFLMLLFIVMFISTTLPNFRRIKINRKKLINYGMVLFVIISFFSYAVYIGVSAFESTVLMGTELDTPSFRDAGTPTQTITTPTIRDQITGKGQPLLLLIFGLIILYGLYNYRNDGEKFVKMLFMGTWGFIGVLAYIITVLLQMGGLYLGPRILVFFYPFILFAAAFVIVDFKLYKRKLVAIFLICFFIVNIATYDFIPGSMVNNGLIPEYYNGKPEISSIQWYSNNGSYVIGGDALHMRSFNTYNGKYATSYQYSPENLDIIKNYDLLYQKSVSYNPKTELKIRSAIEKFDNMSWLSEVYSNGWWQIYFSR
ncbi:MAG: hypothetical protein B655_0764 [Methanobacterium sp. Maddingley MBC34]|nr:MAG: hypothetical protein B655_0764 [Methanobacterium sp. Maddingley MBC34]